jgi:hypothetical protein
MQKSLCQNSLQKWVKICFKNPVFEDKLFLAEVILSPPKVNGNGCNFEKSCVKL